MMSSIFHFFLDNFPPLSLISWLFPLSIVWSFVALFIAGYCKQQWQWKTGYTRKLFHLFIFLSAFFYQSAFQLQGVFILGWSVTIAIIYACFKGNNNLFYEALAREKDAPFRTKYIVYSYVATFVGGVVSNLLFPSFAIFGYAITGIADAIAEPIGTRFGKHQYRVFSFDKTKVSYRSIEGSLAVFIATFCSILLIANSITTYQIYYPLLLLVSLACMFVEAISPSGFDNMLLQICGSFLCAMLFFYQ